MARFADIFVRGSAEDGQTFSYDICEAGRLDDLADLYLRGGPDADGVHSMTVAMGAFVGEIIVRAGLGAWERGSPETGPGLRLWSGLQCFPLTKVSKRLTVGAEHSIAQFVAVARSGSPSPLHHPRARRRGSG